MLGCESHNNNVWWNYNKHYWHDYCGGELKTWYFRSIRVAISGRLTKESLRAVQRLLQDNGLGRSSNHFSTMFSTHVLTSPWWLHSMARIWWWGKSRARARKRHSPVISKSSVSTWRWPEIPNVTVTGSITFILQAQCVLHTPPAACL